MLNQKRWALLEHSGLAEGIHFDLLLEDANACRTWRLPQLLALDGPTQEVFVLPPHSLDWLEQLGRPVSGGRGFAKRISCGFFVGTLPECPEGIVDVDLHGGEIAGNLLIKNLVCSFSSLAIDYLKINKT